MWDFQPFFMIFVILSKTDLKFDTKIKYNPREFTKKILHFVYISQFNLCSILESLFSQIADIIVKPKYGHWRDLGLFLPLSTSFFSWLFFVRRLTDRIKMRKKIYHLISLCKSVDNDKISPEDKPYRRYFFQLQPPADSYIIIIHVIHELLLLRKNDQNPVCSARRRRHYNDRVPPFTYKDLPRT